MVATPFAHARAGAVGVASLFLLTLLPAVPTVTADQQVGQDAPLDHIEVVQGSVYFRQNGRQTQFISNASFGGASEATIYVPIYNYGREVPSARVYIAFVGQWGTPTFTGYDPGDECRVITIPQGTTANPSVTTVAHTFTTSELPPGGYNITVSANALQSDKPAAISASEDCPSTPPAAPYGDPTNPLSANYDSTFANNKANAFLVKDKFLDLHVRELRWCKGWFSPERHDEACDTNMLLSDGSYYNSTPPYRQQGTTADPTYTWLEAIIEPVEGDDNWMDLKNYGGPRAGNLSATPGTQFDGFAYHFNVTVRGEFYNKTEVIYLSWNESTGNATIEDGRAHRARSEPFALEGRAGIQNVTMKVDPGQTLTRHPQNTEPDTAQGNFTVMSYDFTAKFHTEDFRTTSTNPYPYDGPNRIRGNISLQNLGTLRLRDEDININFTVYLNNRSQSEFWRNFTLTEIGNISMAETTEGANEKKIAIDWEYTSNSASSKFLLPGRHRINISADDPDQRLEANESNNELSLEIFIVDVTAPRINGTPKFVIPSAEGPNAPSISELRPLEPFRIFTEVLDDDEGVRVSANFTLNSNPNVTRSYNLELIEGATDYHSVYVSNFNYHNWSGRAPGGFENWTMRIVARDSFNNTVNSTGIPFRLIPWPIHKTPGADVVVSPTYPSATINYGDDSNFVEMRVRVHPNWTGFFGGESEYPNQQTYNANLALNITAPRGYYNISGVFFVPKTNDLCNTENEDPTPGGNGLPTIPGGNTPVSGCPASEEPSNNTFLVTLTKRGENGIGPGLWNYTIRVADIANQTAFINGTIDVKDKAPEFGEVNLSVFNGTADANITPGVSFRVTARVSDDANVADAYVNFTRTDNVFANFTLVNGTDVVVTGTAHTRDWNDTIVTGRGNMLGIGGRFQVYIDAVDVAGNWNRTKVGDLGILDTSQPEIDAGSFGVIPGAAEIGENVTFWAKVRDTTNVTATLNIFRAAGTNEVLFTRQLTEAPDGNFTTTMNFTTEAIHSWEIVPTDSLGNNGAPKTGLLTIRDNLGPKFEVRGPDVVIDGTRYGSATPRIDVVVYDVEGVIPSSVDMRVAGQPVNFQVLDAPGNLNGYLLSYTVPSNRRFEHLDVVDVNLSAKDNSSEQLVSFSNFSFVVDDRAPSARLRSISPSYRDQPAHTLNVSLNSLFTLAAEDIDDLPTEVTSIRYRIIGGGPGGPETIYNGPFRINDAAGVYTGPRIYQVQFWAEDAVGNSGQRTANVTSVYVDDGPPTLIQFFPQPRSVNATFLDDRVGVNNSVLWIRINDAPYTPQEMQEIDGTWRGTLPAGRLGDTVSYYVQVWDKLGNTVTYGNQTNPYGTFDVSNQQPTIRILTPVEGARIPRTVDITWDAAEPDGQALVFKVSVKKPGSDSFTELREITESARRAFTVDLSDQTSYRDGQYTFRVTASDGAFVSHDEVEVTLIKSTKPVGTVLVDGTLAPGEELLITAEVTKAEAIVVARLYLGGSPVAIDGVTDFPMNDEARDGDKVAGDGIYSTKVRISDAGDYRVEIFTQYREDGVTKAETIESAATFNAKLTPGYVMGKFGAIIAIIGLLAAVGIAVAVFVVMRRR